MFSTGDLVDQINALKAVSLVGIYLKNLIISREF